MILELRPLRGLLMLPPRAPKEEKESTSVRLPRTVHATVKAMGLEAGYSFPEASDLMLEWALSRWEAGDVDGAPEFTPEPKGSGPPRQSISFRWTPSRRARIEAVAAAKNAPFSQVVVWLFLWAIKGFREFSRST